MTLRHQFRKNKFNAQKTIVDGITFDSKAEAKRYTQLKQLRELGEVTQFMIQVPFRLPGSTRYVVDFQIFWSNGTVTFEDVKGMETSSFKLKKKQVEELYAPITITVLKSKDIK